MIAGSLISYDNRKSWIEYDEKKKPILYFILFYVTFFLYIWIIVIILLFLYFFFTQFHCFKVHFLYDQRENETFFFFLGIL